MNKMYKTVWCEAKGEWIAVSELTKGKAKSKKVKRSQASRRSRSGHSHKLDHGKSSYSSWNLNKALVGGALLALTSTSAFAGNLSGSCAQANGELDCSGLSGTTGGASDYIIDQSGPASSTTASHHLIVDGVTLNATNLPAAPTMNWYSVVSIGGNNGSEASTGQNYGNITLDVHNSHLTNSDATKNSRSVLYMRTDTMGAVAQLNSNSVLTLNRTGTVAGRTEGILVESFTGGSAVLHLQAGDGSAGSTDSTIVVSSTVAGSTGAGAKVSSQHDFAVTTDAGTSIAVRGDNINGLLVYGARNAGNVGTVRNSGTISTSGASARAIAVSAGPGDVLIENFGQLTTQGNSAVGIYLSGSNGVNGGSIVNRANITTNGYRAHGVYELAENEAMHVDNDDRIVTNGQDASGIRVEHTVASTSGDITVVTGANSYIETNGIEADGIHAIVGSEALGNGTSASSANVTVIADGSIKTNGASTAEGLYAAIAKPGSTGDISATFQGDTIETTGTGVNRGIYIRQDGSGSVTANHFGNSIQTVGAGAYGIQTIVNNTGNSADSLVQVTGDIQTQGARADAIHMSSSALSGDLRTVFEGGTLDVSGDNADGINLSTGAAGGAVSLEVNTLDGQINVLQDNTVAGAASNYGIVAVNTGTGSSGGIAINNINTTINVGNGDGSATQGGAILAQISDAASVGGIAIVNTGNLSSQTSAGVGSVSQNAVLAANNYGSGGVSIQNTGDLSSTGYRANGIYTRAVAGASEELRVVNTGDITTRGKDATGIYLTHSGQGAAYIYNSGSIETLDADSSDRSMAIRVYVDSAASNEGLTIFQDGGTLKTQAYDSHGIFALTSTASSGDINVLMRDTTVSLTGRNSDGIDVQNSAATSNLAINIRTEGGSIDVFDGAVAPVPASGSNYGIVAIQNNAASGDIRIENMGTRITTGANTDGTGSGSDAIMARFSDTVAQGNVEIYNEGVLTTYDGYSVGIRAIQEGAGHIAIDNRGDITTEGQGSRGIHATRNDLASANTIRINNTGDVTANGQAAGAISASSLSTTITGEAITIVNSGDLFSADDRGIYARAASGEVTVVSTGNITTTQSSGTSHNHGMDVASSNGVAVVSYDEGTIQVTGTTIGGGNSIGIASWDAGSGVATQESYIYLGSQAVVDASQGAGGLQIRSNGHGEINLAAGAQVHGGSVYGIDIRGTGAAAGTYVINNAGEIDAANDRAILARGQIGSILTVNNYGTITGYLDNNNLTQVIFNNYSPNSLNLRNFYDSDADGVADTKAVSVSHFGGGSFNNTATGTVRLLAVNGETTTRTAGEYVPTGALSTATAGVVQGQLLNLATFDHAGLIDLTAGGQAGDVLVISGGATPGTDGGGVFISNGGRVQLDSVLTIKDQGTGAYISQSDILVVDSTQLGSAPTKLYIRPVAVNGYQSGITQNDGIQVVEVLGTSDAQAFALGSPVTYGAYEYTLGQGSGANAAHWYLRNTNSNGQVLMSPDAGVYLGNQYAAGTMFNQNILDRRDSVLSADRTLWARTNYSDMSSDLFGGDHELDISNMLLQVGADVYKTDSVVAGVYAGYGHSSIDNKSVLSGSSASGRVNGYQIGAYGSWMPEGENTGPYVDAWGYFAAYDNKLNGASRLGSSSYDSTGYAFSVEAGYSYQFAQQANGNAWIVEPHAQLTYTRIDSDDFTDETGTRYSSNQGSGLQTRLGARIYNQRPLGQYGINPFVEVNWLHNNMDNSIRMDGLEAQSDIGENVGEVKIGLQGQCNKNLSVWGHLGGQMGSDSFKRYEVQLGLGWQW